MSLRRALVFIALLSLTVGCDHATKLVATTLLEPSAVVSVAAGTVRLELVHNPGAFMSLGADLPASVRIPLLLGLMPLAALAAGALALRSTSSRTLSLLAGALFAGGGLSNWLDRLVHDGIVIDFVSIGIGRVRTGIFNVADLAVVIGLLLLIAARPRHRPRAS
jgi:signal peptidase II